jgi:predicted DNA-binding transcriptional regulator AlpA
MRQLQPEPNPKSAVRKLQLRDLCDRYGVSDKTIDRWTKDGILPRPLKINGYRYWDRDEVEAMERDRMAAQSSSNAA